MASRDPEDKRRRLIAAGLDEFSERGLAGARLDRIAKRAECSAGLLYSYFASKEALFDAVFASLIERVVDEVPITADDLPGYAVQLRIAQRQHPDAFRFVAWYELERGADRAVAESDAAHDVKVEAVRGAQARGLVRKDLAPEVILALGLAMAHGYRGPEEGELDAIRDAVSRLVAP